MNFHLSDTRQHGSAMVTALLLVVFIVSIVTLLRIQTQLSLQRTQHLITTEKSYLHALGVEDWAVGRLKDLFQQQQTTATQRWPITFSARPISNGTVSGSIEDLQGRFNLNNLRGRNAIAGFARLLQHVIPSITEVAAMQQAVTIQKALTGQSSSPELNYRNGGLNLTHASELRLVSTLTAKQYQQLAPYIVALPTITKININSATLPVMLAADGSLTAQQAANIETLIRTHGPIKNLRDITTQLPDIIFTTRAVQFELPDSQPQDKVALPQSATNNFTVTSQYFLVKAVVTLKHQRWRYYSVIKITPQRDQTTIKILSRHINTF